MTLDARKRTREAGAGALTIEPIFVDRTTAAAVVALSEPTVERLVREGKFPAPRKISDNRVGWLMSELRAWCLERPVSDLLPPKNTGRKGGQLAA